MSDKNLAVTVVVGKISGGQTVITVANPNSGNGNATTTVTTPTTSGNWGRDVRDAVKPSRA